MRGTNFALQLVPDSLPSGHIVTTGNPRVIQLTADKLSKLNYGVGEGKTIDINLTDDVFIGCSEKLTEQADNYIKMLAEELLAEPLELKVIYH